MEGSTMVSTIVVIAVIGVGWMVWRQWGRRQTPAVSGTAAGVTPERLAFDAFTRGNTCLAEGKFADAIAAFQQARELDPKRPHVADRLAEAERRQAGASPSPAAARS
jgi:predicted negative regulator of RcsB-dependent stress response